MLKDQAIALGAKFAQYQGVETVAEYANGAEAEYRTAKSSVTLMDRSFMGRVELGGADRFEFLQRMSTNDIRNLRVGDGLQTVLTTPEAKIIELLTVYVQPELLLCVTSPQNSAKVFTWFRRNIFFRDKVKPADASASTAQLSLFGLRAANLLQVLTQQDLTPLPSYHSQSLNIGGMETLVARLPHIAGGGYDLICDAAHGIRLWAMLLDAGAALGIKPIGTTAYDWLRLAAAQPLYGYELSEEANPLEAGLNHAISFAKGCYTGQEVIARLDTYKKLKQRLMRLQLTALPAAALPLPLWSGSVEVGTLTSAVRLPDTGDVIGLGYVRAKFAQADAQVRVGTDISATLRELPIGSAEVPA